MISSDNVTVDNKSIEAAVKATREYVSSDAGKKAWYDRRRAKVSDTQNWAISAMEALGRKEYTGEEVARIALALQGRG